MTLLSRDQIFAVSDIETEEVFIPQWNGTVRVKGLTAAERDEYEAGVMQQRGKNIELNRRNIRAKLVALAVVDADGNRVFGDTDVDALGNKAAGALDLIYGVASRLSGFSAEDEEELAKNSGSDLSADSPSA